MMFFNLVIYGSCAFWIMLALGARAGLRLRKHDKAGGDLRTAGKDRAR